MAEMMYWFYRLSFREKILCVLSLVVVLVAVWFYLFEFFETEKKWYLNQIDVYSSSRHKSDQSKDNHNPVDARLEGDIKSLGDVLHLIQTSLVSAPNLQFLNMNISENHIITMKLRGEMVSLVQYLSVLNQQYPDFYWDFIDYHLSDFNGVLEIKMKVYVAKGNNL